MDDIDDRGHSVLTPEGQIQSNRAFARGLGSKYGVERVRTRIGALALVGAVGLLVMAILS